MKKKQIAREIQTALIAQGIDFTPDDFDNLVKSVTAREAAKKNPQLEHLIKPTDTILHEVLKTINPQVTEETLTAKIDAAYKIVQKNLMARTEYVAPTARKAPPDNFDVEMLSGQDFRYK